MSLRSSPLQLFQISRRSRTEEGMERSPVNTKSSSAHSVLLAVSDSCSICCSIPGNDPSADSAPTEVWCWRRPAPLSGVPALRSDAACASAFRTSYAARDAIPLLPRLAWNQRENGEYSNVDENSWDYKARGGNQTWPNTASYGCYTLLTQFADVEYLDDLNVEHLEGKLVHSCSSQIPPHPCTEAEKNSKVPNQNYLAIIFFMLSVSASSWSGNEADELGPPLPPSSWCSACSSLSFSKSTLDCSLSISCSYYKYVKSNELRSVIKETRLTCHYREKWATEREVNSTILMSVRLFMVQYAWAHLPIQ